MTVLDLSCSMWDLCCSAYLLHSMRSLFPNQASNPPLCTAKLILNHWTQGRPRKWQLFEAYMECWGETKQREQSLRSERAVLEKASWRKSRIERTGQNSSTYKGQEEGAGFLQALAIVDKAAAVRTAVLSQQLIGQWSPKKCGDDWDHLLCSDTCEFKFQPCHLLDICLWKLLNFSKP